MMEAPLWSVPPDDHESPSKERTGTSCPLPFRLLRAVVPHPFSGPTLPPGLYGCLTLPAHPGGTCTVVVSNAERCFTTGQVFLRNEVSDGTAVTRRRGGCETRGDEGRRSGFRGLDGVCRSARNFLLFSLPLSGVFSANRKASGHSQRAGGLRPDHNNISPGIERNVLMI